MQISSIILNISVKELAEIKQVVKKYTTAVVEWAKDQTNYRCRRWQDIKTISNLPWHTSEYGTPYISKEELDNMLTKDEIELIDGLVPYGEYGVHSISNITVFRLDAEVPNLIREEAN